jgi:hypothetical protein
MLNASSYFIAMLIVLIRHSEELPLQEEIKEKG